LTGSHCVAGMGQGKKISPEIQQAIVRMLGRLNPDEISMYLDVSTRSVRRVMSYFREYGTIPDAQESAQEERQNNRNNRQLRGVDVEVSIGVVRTNTGSEYTHHSSFCLTLSRRHRTCT